MLHFKTVEPGTLSLLKRLMSIDELKHFALVGGTALALQYGNRTSIDLDLFTTQRFSYTDIVNCLKQEFGKDFEHEEKESDFGIFCFINSIKVDLINYKHLQIDATIISDNIRMYSPKDIAAMKIQAILGRGKKKDFWDIAELLQHYSLAEIMDFHKKKYPSQQLLISIPQALTYFDEAEESEDPISLKDQTWQSVKKIIQQKVSDYLR
jgi:hypothetical protein